ncbi:MAG: hypothetical protein PHN93_01725 [Sphaerochaetaceae bacterium]|nr:hypothetical protein [Sphaerochaetaceae bacterium]MDX9939848.1 hypothetical protein [Sphaerochaetaceae bacterium]
MDLSKLFMLGAAGYVISGLYDVAILRGKTLLQRLALPGFFITAIPYPFLFIGHVTPLPPMLSWMILLCISMLAALLIYSVFIEIPLSGSANGALFRGGTYRLSRHPGFLWYTGINLLVSLYFWEIPILLLCTGLTLCNLLLITVEDLFLFPKIFPDYKEYRKETPFLFSPYHGSHRRKS